MKKLPILFIILAIVLVVGIFNFFSNNSTFDDNKLMGVPNEDTENGARPQGLTEQ